MTVCLHKPGRRVVVYAADHRHYAGTLVKVERGGQLCTVRVDDRGRGEYVRPTDDYPTRCVIF